MCGHNVKVHHSLNSWTQWTIFGSYLNHGSIYIMLTRCITRSKSALPVVAPSWFLCVTVNLGDVSCKIVSYGLIGMVDLFATYQGGREHALSSPTRCRTMKPISRSSRWGKYRPWHRRWKNECLRSCPLTRSRLRCNPICPSSHPRKPPWWRPWSRRRKHPSLTFRNLSVFVL